MITTATTCPPSPATTRIVHDQGFGVIKSRQHAAWSAGDYAIIGTTLQIVGERLCESLDIRSGQRVLDVASGNGSAAIAAARRFCDVTATDFVPSLLERARERAMAERLPIRTEVADAEALPYPDSSFDVVTSTFGSMFTPRHQQSALEMLRVCRSKGKIGLANWTPDGFIGELFKIIAGYVPPPKEMPSPALWGAKAHIARLFEQRADSITAKVKQFVFRYRSADHWIDVFRTYYGPLLKTFEALDTLSREALTADLKILIARFNMACDGTMVVPGDYLEAIIAKS